MDMALTGNTGLPLHRKKQPWIIFLCFLSLYFFMAATVSHAVSYSPPAGQDGSQAIHMDDPAFLYWASGYEHYDI
ncbi:MAG: hypothetical protein Q7U02_06520, partial [Desulfosalsimonadaceae bacterium]|nr:hypothetical protein [Desulfosalsimonadaceae bacterium]